MSKFIFFALAFSIVLFVTLGLIMTGPGTKVGLKSGIAALAGAAENAGDNPSAPSPSIRLAAQNNPSPAPQAYAPSPNNPSVAPAPSAAPTGAGSCGSGSGGCGCGAKIAPRPTDAPNAATPPPPQTGSNGAQIVSVRAEPYGYDHPTLKVKAGIPIEFHFSASPLAGCGRQLLIDNTNVNLISSGGEEQVATFTLSAPGRYSYHCGMRMFNGELEVVA